ncbi:hypothetical protein QR680_005445 [Steinernema hermaphroditum]|uniref:Serum response factor homolog n=1 Tax=Steinernema hermaphroditum TaxID=289476 RepID=A0AA39HS25_9BILA|nr:hypothetical protein QR680_005445 [Steinernema hermaphroditum]
MNGVPLLNLNFSNPGGSGPIQSLLLPPKQTCSSEMAEIDEKAPSLSESPSTSETMSTPSATLLPNGKKTKGRVKIKMEYISNKLRRYTTFSKRKSGIMKKAYELATLTGTQVMLAVVSETNHIYTFATNKLQPMVTSDEGRAFIQNCLNAPQDESSANNICRSEFTFEQIGGSGVSNPRKRKGDFIDSICSMPTMVQIKESLKDDIDSDDDSASDKSPDDGNESDGDEADKQQETALLLQKRLKEALRVAAAERQSQKRSKENGQKSPAAPPAKRATHGAAGIGDSGSSLNALLPFMLQGLSGGSMFGNVPSEDSTTQQLLNSLSFNPVALQQLLAAAALNAQFGDSGQDLSTLAALSESFSEQK